MKVVLMGAPSCGKGIQAKLMEKNFGFVHVSTGQILRDFTSQESKKSDKIKKNISKGEFVKDSLMNQIVQEKLKSLEHQDYVLDGFPRTIKQTKFLLKHNIPDIVLYLQTDKDVAVERVTNRVVCPVCKKSYSKKDLTELICAEDKTPLVTRDDDDLDIYLRRFEIFEQETKPILELFKKEGRLEVISNNGNVEETFTKIAKLLSEKE